MSQGRFAAIFGAVPPGDEEHLGRVVLAAVRDGLAVVLDKPGQKIPLCTLTLNQAKAADKQARQQAEADGRRNAGRVRHPCGLNHALTEEKSVRAITGRLQELYGTFNLGIELGRSRLVAVDVDTAEEKDAFLAAWAEATGEDQSLRSMTVASPGFQHVAPDGTISWPHRDGGHFWFELPPGVVLPEGGPGSLRAPGGWSLVWRDHQILVPPSKRAEGPYRLVGPVEELPDWLLKMIESGTERVQAAHDRTVFADDPIDRWSAATPWATILEEDGWQDTGKLDTCGCPIWTAPGEHASPKSGTAHEVGCALYDTGLGHGPLHIWTDHPPDFLAGHSGSTVSKLTYVALRDHEGDVAAAMAALDLAACHVELDAFELDGEPVVVPQPAPWRWPTKAEKEERALREYHAGVVPTGLLTAAQRAVRRWAEQEEQETAAAAVVQNVNDALKAEAEFWSSRPELQHIHDFARAARVAPWPALVEVLVRVAVSTHYRVRLPPLIGGEVSLALYHAIVGPSGAGKDTARAAAKRALRGLRPLYTEVNLGSGQGVAHAFACWPKSTKENPDPELNIHTRNVLFRVHEIATLAALVDSKGSPLLPELTKAWTGQDLGFNYVDKTKRIPLPALEYQIGLSVGAQPEKCGVLFDDAEGGTPQRFLWTAAGDTDMPEIRPERVEPLEWMHPKVLDPFAVDPDMEPIDIDVCKTAVDELDAATLARNRLTIAGKVTTDLDGHLLLCKEKVAAALGLLADRLSINEEDWQLAGVVMAYSLRVRGLVVDVLKEKGHQANIGKAKAEATRAGFIEDAATERALRRVSGTLGDYLRARAGQWVPGQELRGRLASRDRQWFVEAAHRVERVEVEPTDNNRGVQGFRFRVPR